MKTQRFAAEMEKIASVKMRALEAATLAVPGGVIGLTYARSHGKTRKFDQEDIGGLVAGGVAGGAAALALSATGRLGVYRNKVKQFMQSKKVVDGPSQMVNLTMAERPKWIKEQIKAVDAQDFDNDYFRARAKRQGFLPRGDSPRQRDLARKRIEAIGTNTPRRAESLQAYIRPHQKIMDDAYGDIDSWQSEIEQIGDSPTFIQQVRKDLLIQNVKDKRRAIAPHKKAAGRARALLASLKSKAQRVENLSSTKELKKIESDHEKAIKAAKSQSWEDVDRKYFGLLG